MPAYYLITYSGSNQYGVSKLANNALNLNHLELRTAGSWSWWLWPTPGYPNVEDYSFMVAKGTSNAWPAGDPLGGYPHGPSQLLGSNR